MALHQMAWYGSTPIGALTMGWMIQATSPRAPFVLGGVATLLCAAALVRGDRRLLSGLGALRHRDVEPRGLSFER